MLGVHDLLTMQDMRQVTQPLSRIVRHPQYLGASNDIALLRLSQPVNYSVIIRPICLPPTPGKIIIRSSGKNSILQPLKYTVVHTEEMRNA